MTYRPFKSDNLKYLIGGNPAGGTSFTASYLNACGYPTGHEYILRISDEFVTANCERAVALNSLVSKKLQHGNVIDINEIMEAILSRYERLENTGRVAIRIRVEHDLNSLCSFLGLTPPVSTDGLYSKRHNKGAINLSAIHIEKFPLFNKFKKFASDYDYRQN